MDDDWSREVNKVIHDIEQAEKAYRDVVILGAGITQVSVDELYELELGYIDSFKVHITPYKHDWPQTMSILIEPFRCIQNEPWHNWKYMEGKVLPKPVNTINKQAQVRQSFRQSMRSVNRNK